MKNPFKKENFIEQEEPKIPSIKPPPVITSSESDVKRYEKLLTQYEKKKDEKLLPEIHRLHKILTKDQTQQSPELIPNQNYSEELINRAHQIANQFGANYEQLSKQRQDQILELAIHQTEGEKVLEMLKVEQEDDYNQDLKIQNEKLNQELDNYENELKILQNRIINMDQILIKKDAEIESLKKKISMKDVVQVEPEKDSIQSGYDYLQYNKKNQPNKKDLLKYELHGMELYCLLCKHTIQEHSHGGASNGCNTCGCLKTIEDIAKENKIPLISKSDYQTMKSQNKKSIASKFKPKLFEPKEELQPIINELIHEDEQYDQQTILKQAEALASLATKPKIPSKVEQRAEILQKNTQRKLREESKKSERIGTIPDDACTCGHISKDHFEDFGFCITMDCPCDKFREYPH